VVRRHLYPQTMRRRPPFVLGYDVVGEIDQLGDGVRGFQLGDRVADLTVLGFIGLLSYINGPARKTAIRFATAPG
jgi:NADPH:quinone reductase-like Zn-dependent oxidoreductase